MSTHLSRRAWLAGAAMQAAAQNREPVRLPKKIRIALIGLEGHTGEILRPLPLLPDVELVAICDEDKNALNRASRNQQLAQAKQYTDYRRLLDAEQLDLAAVCGASGPRAPILVACAERKLHIVAEKPLAIERPSLERVKKAVAQNNVRLSMLLPMRFSPVYRAMKQVVDAGEIGDVAQLGGQKSYQLGERPAWMRNKATFGGTIPYIGVHIVDLMRFTSGRELVEAASFQSRIGYPELGDMQNTTATIFRMDNGGTAAIRMDYLRPGTAPSHGDDRLRLAGTKGILEYMAATGLTLVTGAKKPHVITDLPPARSLFVDFLESVYLGKPVGLELRDIYRVNEIVLAAHEAAEKRQIVRT
jgi:predicted dehydrogenase